jgi:dihydrofolate reductase
MKDPKISIIAAIGENRELGKNNKLLWDIPEDMKRFRELTKGHVVIMGRKTYESIGHPLPKRINIIVTRDKKKFLSSHPELDSGSDSGQARMTTGFVCQSLEEAIELAKSLTTHYSLPTTNDEIFIIGGGQIYEQGIKYADKLYLTIVEGKFVADTFFPGYSEFKKTVFKRKSENEKNIFTFIDLKINYSKF